MNNFLLDKVFLKKLNESYNKEKYIRLIALDYQENSIEEIQGKTVSGSINCDGSSSVRRTCTINLIVPKTTQINIVNWSLNSKFKVFIGLKNDISKEYEDICWFPQGIFLITNCSIKYGLNGINISINGRDKMALLNGDIGGIIPALHNFSEVDIQQADGTFITEQATLYNIILNAVHTYGKEPYSNIVINDLSETGISLMDYKVSSNILFLFNIQNDKFLTYSQPFFEGTENFNNLPIEVQQLKEKSKITINGTTYTLLKKCKYGDTAGYRATDFTYPGKLEVQAGTSIVNGVLDPIVKVLGNYEYFYNVHGKFVFQEKKNYLNKTWNIFDEEKKLLNASAFLSPNVYEFENNNLISSFSNTPQLSNFKNDFIVWGTKSSNENVKNSIHMRLAIDEKPIGESLEWRENLYQMALSKKENTGYEIYYADLETFWRTIYNPDKGGWLIDLYPTTDLKNVTINDVVYPENLIFWIDFLDTEGEYSEYSIKMIGHRPKVINDSQVKSISYRDTPSLLFVDDERKINYYEGYDIFFLPKNFSQYFDISSQSKSAYSVIEENLYSSIFKASSIQIQTIPIYFLQPNQRILIDNQDTNIKGEYVIKSFSIPLNYNGMMTITANEAVNRLY